MIFQYLLTAGYCCNSLKSINESNYKSFVIDSQALDVYHHFNYTVQIKRLIKRKYNFPSRIIKT